MLSYSFPALQFMLSVSFDARWHLSFHHGVSITLILEFNDSWDGKTNLGGYKNKGRTGFGILGSQSCAFSVAFVRNNNGWNTTQCTEAMMQWTVDKSGRLHMTNFVCTVMYWEREIKANCTCVLKHWTLSNRGTEARGRICLPESPVLHF